jgi:hypothetical protein
LKKALGSFGSKICSSNADYGNGEQRKQRAIQLLFAGKFSKMQGISPNFRNDRKTY